LRFTRSAHAVQPIAGAKVADGAVGARLLPWFLAPLALGMLAIMVGHGEPPWRLPISR
jgi:hypothetical protein